MVALGLMLTGYSLQGAPAQTESKTMSCCEQQLACCTEPGGPSACCVAMKRLGCCEKGMTCCKEDRGCCDAVQECCAIGMECCAAGKACCGPKSGEKAAGVSAETETIFAKVKPECCQKAAAVK